MRGLLAAVVLAAVTGFGGAAGATQMQAVLNGDFNDDPLWDHWTVTIDYDTAAGVVTPTTHGGLPGFEFDGTATAIHGTVRNQTQPNRFCDLTCLPSGPATFDLSGAPLTIERTLNAYTFGFSGGAISASGLGFDATLSCYSGHGAYCAPDLSAPVGPFDEAWSRTGYFDYGSWNLTSIGVRNSMPHNHGLQSVTPLSVPEPATWTTMILGLVGMGLTLRRGARAMGPRAMACR